MPEPLTYFFLILPLSSLFFFLQTSHGDMLASQHCTLQECGSLNISYPFWLWDDTTSDQYYCGYPGFTLTCSNGETMFSLQGESFYVKNISYTNHTLTLVDTEVSSQTCPRLRQNVTLQPLPPLSYSSLDLNLSFYYNCSGLETGVIPIECLSSTTNKSYAVLGGTDAAGFGKWYDFCEEKVVVAVMMNDAEANRTNLISGFNGAMKDGFVLDWLHAPVGCSACEAWNSGMCGYNPANDSYMCFGSGEFPSWNNRGKGMLFSEYFEFKSIRIVVTVG